MKRFIKSALTLSALLTFSLLSSMNPAVAQLSSLESIKDRAVTPASSVLSSRRTAEKFALPLEITRMDGVQGHTSESDIRVSLKNNSRQTVDLTTYSLTGNTKGASFSIRITTAGPFTIQPGSTQLIEGTFARTSDVTDIEFNVTGVERDTGTRHTASKQIRLPGAKILWVVKYGTEGKWVLAGVYRGDFGDPNVNINASKLAKSLKDDYGFNTKRGTKTETGVFGIGGSHRASVYAQTSKKLERTFDNQQAAKAFHDALRRVNVPASLVDRVIQVGNTTANLSAKRLELIRRRALNRGG